MGQPVNLRADSKTGYSFVSWSDGVDTEDRTVTVSENMELAVVYTLNSYSISYELNGGEVSTGNPTQYTVDSSFTLNRPEKKGYIFEGWTGTGLTEKTLDVTISLMTGNRSYTANFVPITYSIAYSSNGGSGSMQNTSATFDSKLTLPTNTFISPKCHVNLDANGGLVS
jgi:uncharacterized repeat protein (TIGR02543 family)